MKTQKKTSTLARRKSNRTEPKSEHLALIPVPTNVVARSCPSSMPKLAWKMLPSGTWQYVKLS